MNDPYMVDLAILVQDGESGVFRREGRDHIEIDLSELMETDRSDEDLISNYCHRIGEMIRETRKRFEWPGCPGLTIAHGRFPDVGFVCADGDGNLRKPEKWGEVAQGSTS